MNFIEAAIAILEESRKALSVEDITTLAMERKLITKPGKDPARTMRARLDAELEKGEASRVKQVGDRFRLEKGAAAPVREQASQKTAKKAAGQKKTTTATAPAKGSKAAAEKAPASKAAKKAPAKAAGKATKATAKKAGKAAKAAADRTAGKAAGRKAAKATAARATRKEAGAVAPVEEAMTPIEEIGAPAVAAEEPAALALVPEALIEPAIVAHAEPAPATPVSIAVGQFVPERPGGRKKRRRRRGRGGGGGGMSATPAAAVRPTAEGALTPEAAPAPTAALAESPEAAPEAAAVAAEAPVVETVLAAEAPELGEILAPRQQIRRGALPHTPDEEDIEELYGDELAGTEPGAAFAEYEDEQTEDEDRPLVPEMVADRRDRRKRERMRRSERRMRGERPERGERRERPEREARPERPEREARPERPEREARTERPEREARTERPEREARREMPAMRAPAERAPWAAASQAEPTAVMAGETIAEDVAAGGAPLIAAPVGEGAIQDLYRPGTSLGDAAAEVLREARSEHPIQIKQLAQMMRKRQLITEDPAEVWPYIKAALLADEQRHRDLGLRPRIIYRGRDMFSVAPRAASAALADAEAALGQAAYRLAEVAHQALKQRLSSADVTVFERVAHVYLLANGWKDVQWIKRVQRSSYAVGNPPGGLGTVLIGVRAGSDLVDRRGIGELRFGVMAKSLTCGLLLATQDLSDVARKELANKGASVSVLVGDAFVAELIRCGIGALRKSVPAVYFDEGFFAEIESA